MSKIGRRSKRCGHLRADLLAVSRVGAPRAVLCEGRCGIGESKITPIDICVSMMGVQRATGYFIHDWGLKDGTAVRFECVDVFEFDDNGLIEQMIIVYDTHPIRSTVGDKYA